MVASPLAVNERPHAPQPQRPNRSGFFERMAAWTIRATGGRWGFLTAFLIVAIWAISGPFFHYSELWQLIINTGTTIVTFLMVFLIQNAQNRESKAVHLKLDELILAMRTARNEMINIEALTEEELETLAERYRRVADRHHKLLEARLAAKQAAQSAGAAAYVGAEPEEPSRQ